MDGQGEDIAGFRPVQRKARRLELVGFERQGLRRQSQPQQFLGG